MSENSIRGIGSAFLNSVATRVIMTLAMMAMPFMLGFALWAGLRYFEANQKSIDTLTKKYDELAEQRFEDRLAEAEARAKIDGKIEQINEFARDGGRYTQDEANADLARQDKINQQLASTLERVTDKLTEHIVDAAQRFNSTPRLQ